MDALNRPASALLQWYRQVKRDLPWRQTKDPYHIWISEIMLQQTRVETVKGYYQRFLALFPTIHVLAAAPEAQVLKAWEGLGYYSRARNLQKAAKIIVFEHNGYFPREYETILKLPGIGAYTAGAVASIAFGAREPAIDGNVNRVAARFFGIREDIGAPKVQRQLRGHVTASLPMEHVGNYNQALMELGATVCLPGIPKCDLCPWRDSCDAYAEGDADALPIHEKKRPPKTMDVAVCLVTYENQILVTRRSQRMLQGLFVFDLIEEETDEARICEALLEQGLACAPSPTFLGTARHVFTHRVWEMRLWHFTLTTKPNDEILSALHAHFVDKPALLALPFPTAMKAAREKALTLLS